jgi:hypothetical protein
VPFYDAISGSMSQIALYQSQLLNFSVLLIMACERGAVCFLSHYNQATKEAFIGLKGQYKNTLISVDEYLGVLVETIGELWFGMKSQSAGNPMMEMMKGLMG